MNTKLYKYIISFVLTVITLPVVAQDYLTIHFKNGNKERHLMSLVKEISASKYDQAGELHSDYVAQVVAMEDITYYYDIDDIDSISFKSVCDEQIYQNFTSALTIINKELDNCKTVNDIKSYANEIANASGVEKVDVYENSVVVRIKDCRDIVFLDIPKKEGMVPYNKTRQANQSLLDINMGSKINQSIRVAIADQNAKNENEGYVESTKILHEIEEGFSKLDYDVKYIPQPGLDFFRKDIFDYDIIMLTTHGDYIDGKHWFATGVEIEEYNPSLGWSKDKFERYYDKHSDYDDIKYLYVLEERNGVNKWILYTICSEDYIDKSPYRFKNNNAILFTNVCESLTKKTTVADMFFRKGASTYIGYVGTTYWGEYVGRLFFCELMLNGTSAEYAFEKIPEWGKIEKEKDGAILKWIPKDGSKPRFVTKTITAPPSEIESRQEKNDTYSVTFYGYTTMRQNSDFVKMGFRVSNNSDMSNSSFLPFNSNYVVSDSPNGNYRFFSSLSNAKPKTTIYYRAYTYDGLNYNYGDKCSFTLYPNLQIAAQKLELGEGEKVSFTITAGSGEYSVESSDKSVAKANVVGNEVYIEAISGGKDVTITVTDTKSGQKATVTVIVISYGPPLSVGDTFTADGVKYKVISIKPFEVQIGNCEKGSGIESAIARNKTGAYEIPSKVTGPDGNSYSVTMLGRYSFYKCSLTSISIPNSVTSIGEHAFSDCSGLTSIKIPESVTSIGDYAFYECSGLTSIKIPESVISIGSLAFYGCSGLYSIIIPKNVSSIGYFAFNKCSYLHTVIILCSSSNIDSGLQLFKDCNNITEAVFDCSTVIPILNDLTSLKKVTLKESVTTIGDNAFYNCSGLTSITIPNSVTNIGKAAFAYCGLPSLTIPNSVTRIGEEAFAYCSSLSFATISNRLNSIGGGVFRDCSSLTSVTIPSSVTFIEGYAFTGCNSLTSVSIPNSVTSIGTMAFAGCSSLTSIYVEAIDPPKLELYWVFDGVDENKCVLYVPKGCVDKYRSEMIWGSFKNIVEH